jgi:hypothetical protein
MEKTQETTKKEKFDFGAIAGSVIIVVLLLIAGWYFYQELEKINDDLDDVNRADSMIMREEAVTPDSVGDDLSNNPFDDIQKDMDDIQVEFDSSSEVRSGSTTTTGTAQ